MVRKQLSVLIIVFVWLIFAAKSLVFAQVSISISVNEGKTTHYNIGIADLSANSVAASVGEVSLSGHTVIWSFFAEDGTVPSVPQSIIINILDARGIEVSHIWISLTIRNVAPTANFDVSVRANGETVTADLVFTNPTDPSPIDTSTGFLYSYDCDASDGNFDEPFITSPTYSGCTYQVPGTYTVRGRIYDKDGEYTEYSKAIDVTITIPEQWVTVNSVVQGGDAQPGDFTLKVGDTVVTNGVPTSFAPGQYVVNETGGPQYYAAAFSGDCDANGNLTVAAGQSYICTITNIYNPPPPPEPRVEPALQCPVEAALIPIVPTMTILAQNNSLYPDHIDTSVTVKNTSVGYFVVVNTVGHPELGCPASGDPNACNEGQMYESFDIFVDGNMVGNVPDDGEDNWFTHSFDYALSAGEHTILVQHVASAGPDSVSFNLAYCVISEEQQ